MKLYFAPLACSLATRIALYEAGAAAQFEFVDIHKDPYARPLPDGSDYRRINPMGQVPAIQADDGTVVTENTAVLLFVAENFPAAKLVPATGIQRLRLFEWMSFIATELHKATFIPLLDPHSSAEVKDYARQKLPLRFGHLEEHLALRTSLLDHFSIADCYLVTVLNWTRATGIALARWPAIQTWFSATTQRPSVARALEEEGQLWYALQKRLGMR